MNEVILVGYIQDESLTMRTTSAGDNVLNFTVRVKRNKETVDFIDCTAWKVKADFISKYFKKGDPIIVVGRLSTSVYEKNGIKIKKYVVDVDNAEFCPVQKPELTEPPAALKIQSSFEPEEEDAPWI